MVGLAEPNRLSFHDVGSDIAVDVFRDRFLVGIKFRHQNAARRHETPTALEWTPAAPSYNAFVTELRL